MKRIFATLLAIILILSLVGCGGNKREIVKLTLSTEDSEAILAAAGITLPPAEETAASGSTIKWLSWWDSFHNYADDEIINTGFWTFQEKYGCDVEWIETTYEMRFDDLANLILTGNAPDFYPAGMEIFPSKVLRGMFQPVDSYIDYNDPLWEGMRDYVYTYYSLNDRPYVIGTDTGFDNVVAYNRRVISEWGFDDPATLYYNDEWTWDVFYDMCVEFSDPDEDRYALDGWSYNSGIMHSCGEVLVPYDTETHRFYTNIDSPAIEKAANLLYELNKNECIYPRWNNGWAIRSGAEGGGMREGLCLFYIRGTWSFTGPVDDISAIWGDITNNELMFCPLPRDPSGDGCYYSESTISGYCIVSGAENPEGVALLAACDRFKVLDPTVVSIDRKQLEETYLWTEEMLEMYDECYRISSSENVVVVYNAGGYSDKISSTLGTLEGVADAQEASTWAQLKEQNSEKLAYYVDELNMDLDEYVTGE